MRVNRATLRAVANIEKRFPVRRTPSFKNLDRAIIVRIKGAEINVANVGIPAKIETALLCNFGDLARRTSFITGVPFAFDDLLSHKRILTSTFSMQITSGDQSFLAVFGKGVDSFDRCRNDLRNVSLLDSLFDRLAVLGTTVAFCHLKTSKVRDRHNGIGYLGPDEVKPRQCQPEISTSHRLPCKPWGCHTYKCDRPSLYATGAPSHPPTYRKHIPRSPLAYAECG